MSSESFDGAVKQGTGLNMPDYADDELVRVRHVKQPLIVLHGI